MRSDLKRATISTHLDVRVARGEHREERVSQHRIEPAADGWDLRMLRHSYESDVEKE